MYILYYYEYGKINYIRPSPRKKQISVFCESFVR